MECSSASLYTATERTPIFLAVRITRHAISPRLAIRTFSIFDTPKLEKHHQALQIHFTAEKKNLNVPDNKIDTYIPHVLEQIKYV